MNRVLRYDRFRELFERAAALCRTLFSIVAKYHRRETVATLERDLSRYSSFTKETRKHRACRRKLALARAPLAPRAKLLLAHLHVHLRGAAPTNARPPTRVWQVGGSRNAFLRKRGGDVFKSQHPRDPCALERERATGAARRAARPRGAARGGGAAQTPLRRAPRRAPASAA